MEVQTNSHSLISYTIFYSEAAAVCLIQRLYLHNDFNQAERAGGAPVLLVEGVGIGDGDGPRTSPSGVGVGGVDATTIDRISPVPLRLFFLPGLSVGVISMSPTFWFCLFPSTGVGRDILP